MPNKEHILDLDALTPEPRYVVIGGKRHEILPITLEMYAKSVQLQEDMERIQNGEYSPELLERIYETIIASVPTLDVPTLKRLNIFALRRLMNHIEESANDALRKIQEADGVKPVGESEAAEGGGK